MKNPTIFFALLRDSHSTVSFLEQKCLNLLRSLPYLHIYFSADKTDATTGYDRAAAGTGLSSSCLLHLLPVSISVVLNHILYKKPNSGSIKLSHAWLCSCSFLSGFFHFLIKVVEFGVFWFSFFKKERKEDLQLERFCLTLRLTIATLDLIKHLLNSKHKGNAT